MILKPAISWQQVSSLKAPMIYWRNVIVILENPTKVFLVDAWRDQLGKYVPPSQVSIFKYYYKIGQVDEESVKYLECVADAVQRKVRPLIVKRFNCEKDIVVMLP
ncbi:hypothetical protein GWK48_03430 [Metallosphaera tengchongensis]|uniref:Uncharacterized protein n=1 Tax=Metallosphaera tengchongensis TaxID=1532350 RepID=A0A6N0NWS9_9CREN|nr:hypothetical protein [Metallosphaera tengchongensis]QKQ99570.1 hypothetical protein GWK48_03430 [Metallosphaera tengchongensis]